MLAATPQAQAPKGVWVEISRRSRRPALRSVLFGATYPARSMNSHLGGRATYLLGRDIGPAGGRATYLPLLPTHYSYPSYLPTIIFRQYGFIIINVPQGNINVPQVLY